MQSLMIYTDAYVHTLVQTASKYFKAFFKGEGSCYDMLIIILIAHFELYSWSFVVSYFAKVSSELEVSFMIYSCLCMKTIQDY